ncbi:MacB family efflux pump subunit [Rhodocyclus tenuis]|uniref:Pyoverdine export ATP-binding/permease protein PvdT n=1 Tax=Rhodocyclus tenuis TaxID=1066 RepID=A0A840GAJ5_RHOTE|nr:MacB family efflux pump subunit [Rhodocyclus tenuis]MBB4247688.1 macrolide transport system ATP-binding/permease protein [Rhodocyclus tenuis]
MTPLIELRAIHKRYGGGDRPEVGVLHGIDLAIGSGEFVAIVGASGSGKSTLMNIIGCLDRPSAGHYRFAGRDVADFAADRLAWLRREAFGFVFQGYHLIASETARENVEVPALYAGLPEGERRRRASALLERLGLGDRQDNRPNQLSGGQQQRVSIARALVNGGRIILADEPTGALDSRSGAEVMALLRELATAGHTVILITHDRDVAAQAERVIEIHDGRITHDSGARTPSVALPLPALDVDHEHGASLRDELAEATRTAWRAMRINRGRTGLTLLGIVIGVASVILMLAIGEGARQRVIEQIGSMGTTIMYLGSKPPVSGGPIGTISDDDLDAIRSLPQVHRTMPVIGDPILVRHGNVERTIYVYAGGETLPEIFRWPVERGRFFSAREQDELAPVVVAGNKAFQQFFPGVANPIGRQLLIGNAPFEVIGVMSSRGTDGWGQNYDDMVFIPYRAGRARVYRTQTQPDYTLIDVVSPDVVDEAEDAIGRLLINRHGREDFGIGNAAARIKAEMQTREAMTLMLSLIAAVSLVVGGIGVMNVMLMTVRERTREIGIRMATGARQRDIQRQFLTEAVLIALSGGLIGVASGLAIGFALLLSGIPVVFSLTASVGAFACAIATGLVFGWLPARQASRLDPVVALAGE